MIVQAYGAALLIILSSAVVGRAICAAAGGRQRWWAAPVVGLAALIIVADAAIKLPGNGGTAAGVEILVVAAAVAYLWRSRSFDFRRGDIAVGAAALLWTSLPFIASGRVGLQGVSLNNDSATHLLLAEGLRSSRMLALWGTQIGYPVGPHSLVASLGTASGMPLDLAFAGLLIAIAVVTALAAAGVLASEALWRRVVVGSLCALPYLAAAYYGEGAFKETIMGGLVLAFVLHLEQVQARWTEATGVVRFRLMLPALVLVAGAVYTYSYLGLAWFGLAVVLWLAAEAIRRPAVVREWTSRRRLSAAAPWLAGMAALAVIAVLPVAGQALSFLRTLGISPSSVGAIPGSFGNLVAPLSPYESLSIWLSPDFRYGPMNTFHAGELSAFALGVVVYGVWWSLRRRRLLMPATAAGCAVVWLLAKRSGSPYVAAKALVIAAPVFMALGLRGLLIRRPDQLSARAFRLAIALVFCALAAYSSYDELRNEPVQAPDAGRELAGFHRTIGDSAVLFLGDDDYSPWQLRPAAVTALAAGTRSIGAASARRGKPYTGGQALDFDSVVPAELDHFRYVITSNTPYASQPPANFRLLSSERLYDLWERTGPTIARQILEPPGSPGAILGCRSPLGKKLRAARGEASIMAAPVTTAGPGLFPGAAATVSLALPTGSWELSIQYVSSFEVDLSAQGRRWSMPAYLGHQGPLFAVGTVTGQGAESPVTLTIKARRPSVLSGDRLFASVPMIAATRVPDVRRVVPLKQACGRYVDWYRLS